MTRIIDHAIRTIVSQPSRYYLVIDPCGWADDNEFGERARENGIDKVVSEEMKLEANLNEEGTILFYFQDISNRNIIELEKKYDPVHVDLQPLSIFPTLDPTISSYLSSDQVERIFDMYSFKEGSVRGEKSTIGILMKELYDVDIDRLSDKEYLLGECIRLMASGNKVPRYWIDRISDSIVDLGVSEKSSLFNDPEILADLLNKKSITGDLTGYTNLMKRIVSIQTMDDGIVIDTHSVKESIEDINWSDLHLTGWMERWRELALLGISKEYDSSGEMERINFDINEKFIKSLDREYDQLQQLSWIRRPPLIWRINDHIDHNSKNDRALLLIVDCLSLPMWEVINAELKKIGMIPEIETSTITWIPTLTSVCRQSILSGLRPIDFTDTFKTTSAEKRLWTRYWEGKGINGNQIEYMIKVEEQLSSASGILDDDNAMRVAFIMNSIDEIVHASCDITNFNWNDMIKIIRNKLIPEVFIPLMKKAMENGWTIYITSDHGNHKIFSKSEDKKDGVLTELKGQRCKIFENLNLVQSNQSKRTFQPLNVFPDGYVIISSEYGSSFGSSKGWGHGGVSWDEMMVPFVKYGGRR
ncbi:MAG: PglZ domain-containing protein [Candidatus Hodarchaeales archaeon]